MIQIEGLTAHQTMLLDTMWEKDTHEELQDWMQKITPNNRRMVEVLIHMVQLAYIDSEINCTSDLSLANELIEKARKSVDK
jgi:uncharacterized protein YukE